LNYERFERQSSLDNSGIGRLMSLKFSALGTKVIAWDMNQIGLAQLEKKAEQSHLFIQGMLCDVSDSGVVVEKIGHADVFVNNASVASEKPLLDTPDQKIVKTMIVNVLAHFWTCKAFLPSMLERNRWHIVTIASTAGLIGIY
jgi:all-trans-retinol dehydrogenase (NAD+)